MKVARSIVVSHQDLVGSEARFSGCAEQLVLEMPYDKEGYPVPERANIYRLSTDHAVSSAAKIRSHQAKVKEGA